MARRVELTNIDDGFNVNEFWQLWWELSDLTKQRSRAQSKAMPERARADSLKRPSS